MTILRMFWDGMDSAFGSENIEHVLDVTGTVSFQISALILLCGGCILFCRRMLRS